MSSRGFSRRSLVRGAGAATLLGVSGYRLSFAADATPGASPAAAAATPVGKIGADGYYPSGHPEVPDAWTKYPKPFKATEGAPGTGGEVTALVLTYSAPPVARESNTYWQELEKRLNVKWSPTLAPNANYGEKATALLASGSMPDLFYINTVVTNSPLQKFVVEGAFTDLTEYVTGDALKEYPNLSKIPEFMWNAAKTKGKLYGVPCPTPKAPQLPAFRTDWSEKLIGHDPQNAQEVHDVLVGMSKNDPDGDGKNNTWGGSKYGTYWSNGLILNMFKAPNGWAVDSSGAFTSVHETDAFKEYLDFCAKLYKDGAYPPDVLAMEWDKAYEMFCSGKTGFHTDGSAIYGRNEMLERIRQFQPTARVGRLIPPGKDGGKGVGFNGNGIFGYTAIPATVTDKEKIKELLRILDYFSAPYGSEEYTFLNSGLEGVHYKVNEYGFPIRTEKMDKEWGQLTAYLGGSMPVNTNPLQPEIGPIMTDEQNAGFAIGIDNPIVGLYSQTDSDKGGQIGQKINDLQTEIIVGRATMADMDKAVEEWRKAGGDKIKQEYAEEYAKNKK